MGENPGKEHIAIMHLLYRSFVLMLALYAALIAYPGSDVQRRSISSDVFRSYLSQKIPRMRVNDDGAMGRNVKSFHDIATQRSGLLLIQHGMTFSNASSIEKGVRALAYPFRFQNDNGTFQCPPLGDKPVGPGDLYGEGMLIGAVGEAVLLMHGTQYAEGSSPMLLAHSNAVKRWLTHFISVKDEVIKADTIYCNRLAFNALAFLSFGIIFEDTVLKKMADELLSKTMEMQDISGYYPDKGGPDTSYNAVTAWKMQICSIYASEPMRSRILVSVKKAMQWEMAHIDASSGEVSTKGNVRTGNGQERFLGNLKDVNYEEVAYSLFYWQTVGGSKEAGALGMKVFDFMMKKYAR